MKKFVKWFGIILGSIFVLLVALSLVGFVRANRLLTRKWDYVPDSVQIPTDADSVTHGEYLTMHFMLCTDCHGPDLGGAEFFTADEGAGTLWAPNLTSGQGGIGGTYSDADWLRSLRHGIRPNGENLIIMPADFYTTIDINDMADIIAYLKTLPPVDRKIPERNIAPLPKIMLGLGIIPTSELLPSNKIDHTAIPQPSPEHAITAEYGQYLAKVCTACHGVDLGGMPSEFDGAIPAPNLTKSGELGSWSEVDFLKALQNGVTPDGKTLDPEQMPWPRVGSASEEDLQAIWLYLQTLPDKASN